MADSLRTDGARVIDHALYDDRDAKIEQLLLAGLDHYFSGRYEQAIDVWTRTLFFDRSHARARAYRETLQLPEEILSAAVGGERSGATEDGA